IPAIGRARGLTRHIAAIARGLRRAQPLARAGTPYRRLAEIGPIPLPAVAKANVGLPGRTGRWLPCFPPARSAMHPIRRALPVIDVQNAYFDGQLPIGFPDRRRSLANII